MPGATPERTADAALTSLCVKQKAIYAILSFASNFFRQGINRISQQMHKYLARLRRYKS